jgi:hypothetical protein
MIIIPSGADLLVAAASPVVCDDLINSASVVPLLRKGRARTLTPTAIDPRAIDRRTAKSVRAAARWWL